MNRKHEIFRFAILGAGVALVFLVFIYQLVFIQISQGEAYKKKVTQGYSRVQTVVAARGEIVDRYGRPFTTNRIGLDIILDQAYLPSESKEENRIILELITLMESMGQGWIDNLPISAGETDAQGQVHFSFLPEKETEIARLKQNLEIAPSATADDCMYWLADSRFYSLEPWADSPTTQRKLAGVRYEMAQQNFGYKNNYTFARDVSSSVATNVQERGYALPGVDVIQSTVREYNNGTLAPHIIGTTGPIYQDDMTSLKKAGLWWSEENQQGYKGNDIIGKSGIESAYERLLRGKNGERRITLNAQHQVVNVEETVAPTPGNTVVLTLDKDLQQVTQDALADQIKNLQTTGKDVAHGKDAKAGAAVCVSVKTGDILAMATYPSYDVSTYYQDYDTLKVQKPEPLLNRATMGTYRPGSTYKPSVAVAGLAEGVITPTETILCHNPYLRFAPSYTPSCSYAGGCGQNTVVRALQRSCNIFFYETGWRLGIQKQNEYSAHFGLGSKTGIEIPEAKGQLSGPETRETAGDRWTSGNVIQSAIGQLDHGFTPVQMAGYVATLASDGARMQLHLVKSVKSYSFEETVEETQPQVIDQVPASKGVFATVREGMVAATGPAGTSYQYWIGFPLTVASKTGTPESLDSLTSCYICYLPAEDPEIAIAVVIENGGQGYTGAPVARKIAQQYFFGGNDNEEVLVPNQLLP